VTCEDARPLIHGYADRELDLRTSLDVEQHLKECASCARERESLALLQSTLKQNAPYYQASAALRRLVRSSTRAAVRAEQGSRWRLPFSASAWRWPVAAAVAAVLVAIVLRDVISGPSIPGPPPIGGVLAREVVASHVRSLMANHLTDILSSNQHTVKPWFDGKLDFAPPVQDLSAQGFPLVGGRLDFLDGRPVAALVYRYHLHIINLFTWPTERASGTVPQFGAWQGYNTVHWTKSGMEYWAVSDVAPSELERFARLVREGGPQKSPQ
jgi:anti-sigma factor RsiW